MQSYARRCVLGPPLVKVPLHRHIQGAIGILGEVMPFLEPDDGQPVHCGENQMPHWPICALRSPAPDSLWVVLTRCCVWSYVRSPLVADHDAPLKGSEPQTEYLHRGAGLDNERLTRMENDPLDRLRSSQHSSSSSVEDRGSVLTVGPRALGPATTSPCCSQFSHDDNG